MKLWPYWTNLLLFLAILAFFANRRHIFFGITPVFNGQPVEFLSISLYALDFVLFALVIWKFRYMRKNPRGLEDKWPGYALIFVILAIYAFMPRETRYGAYFTIIFLVLLFLAAPVKAALSHETIRKAFRIFTAFAVGESFLALYQFTFQKSLGLWFLGEAHLGLRTGIAKIDYHAEKLIRPYGTFPHPNILGCFLFVACATSLYLLITSKRRKERNWLTLALLINTLGLVITFSRTAILTWALFLIGVTILLYIKRGLGEYRNKILIAVLFFLISCLSLSSYLVARAPSNDSATLDRVRYNQMGIELIKKRPWFGWTTGNTIPEIIRNNHFTEEWQIQPPHNYFILVACETGLIGLLIVLLVFWNAIKEKILQIVIDKDLLLNIFLVFVFFGFIFLMLFDHYFYDIRQTQVLLWTWIGLMIAKKTSA